jgi:hypothetical protein
VTDPSGLPIDPYAILDLITGAAPVQDDILCPSPASPGAEYVGGRSNARRKSDRRKSILVDDLDLYGFSMDDDDDDDDDGSDVDHASKGVGSTESPSSSVQQLSSAGVGGSEAHLSETDNARAALISEEFSRLNIGRRSEESDCDGDADAGAQVVVEECKSPPVVDKQLESPGDEWLQDDDTNETQTSRRQSISLDLLPAFDLSYDTDEEEVEGAGEEQQQVEQASDTPTLHQGSKVVSPKVQDEATLGIEASQPFGQASEGGQPATTSAFAETGVVAESPIPAAYPSSPACPEEETKATTTAGSASEIVSETPSGGRACGDGEQHRGGTSVEVSSPAAPVVQLDFDACVRTGNGDDDGGHFDTTAESDWKQHIRAYVWHGAFSQEGIAARVYLEEHGCGYKLETGVPVEPAKQYTKGQKPRKSLIKKLLKDATNVSACVSVCECGRR